MQILDQGELAVTNSAAAITSSVAKAKKLIVKNIGAADIFIGNASVTTANGLPIGAGEPFAIDIELDRSEGLLLSSTQFIVAAGAENLRYIILG